MDINTVNSPRGAAVDQSALNGIASNSDTCSFMTTQARPNCVPTGSAGDKERSDFPVNTDFTAVLNKVEMNLNLKPELSQKEVENLAFLTYLNQAQNSCSQTSNNLFRQEAELSESRDTRFLVRTIKDLLAQVKLHLERLHGLAVQATTTSISMKSLQAFQTEVNRCLAEIDDMSRVASELCQSNDSMRSWWNLDSTVHKKSSGLFGLGLDKFSLAGPKGTPVLADKYLRDTKGIYIPSKNLYFFVNGIGQRAAFIAVKDETGMCYVKFEAGAAPREDITNPSDEAIYYAVEGLNTSLPEKLRTNIGSNIKVLNIGNDITILMRSDSGTEDALQGDGGVSIFMDVASNEWSFKATDKPVEVLGAALARVENLHNELNTVMTH